MSRNRLLLILVAVIALGVTVYSVALRPAILEGVVDHKTITGAREGISYTIVVFTVAGNHFDDEEARGLFDETNRVNGTVAYQLESRYDEVFFVVSVRSGDETVGFFTSREDFNRVVPGSRVNFNIQSPEESVIRILRVLD